MNDTLSGKRDVLVSVRPFFASKILDGRKTVELRRKFPSAGVIGGIAIIYSSRPVGAVVAYARIKTVAHMSIAELWREFGVAACISKPEFDDYFSGVRYGFAIVLEAIKPLKEQCKAADLERKFGIVPPQSYRYVSGQCVAVLSDDEFQATD